MLTITDHHDDKGPEPARGPRHIALSGRLDALTTPDAETRLLPLSEVAGADLLLDMRGLEYISSAGLRLVLMLAKRVKAGQGRFRLCGLTPPVRQVFEISGFLGILDVRDDCE